MPKSALPIARLFDIARSLIAFDLFPGSSHVAASEPQAPGVKDSPQPQKCNRILPGGCIGYRQGGRAHKRQRGREQVLHPAFFKIGAAGRRIEDRYSSNRVLVRQIKQVRHGVQRVLPRPAHYYVAHRFQPIFLRPRERSFKIFANVGASESFQLIAAGRA